MFLDSDVIRKSSDHLYVFRVFLVLDSYPEAVDEPLLPMQLLPDVPDSLKSIEKQLQSEKKCIESGILVLILVYILVLFPVYSLPFPIWYYHVPVVPHKAVAEVSK